MDTVEFEVSPKNKGTCMLLCAIGLIGIGGVHDFYLGRAGMGIIKFLTGNFLVIGTIVDLIHLSKGTYRDSDGRLVMK